MITNVDKHTDNTKLIQTISENYGMMDNQYVMRIDEMKNKNYFGSASIKFVVSPDISVNTSFLRYPIFSTKSCTEISKEVSKEFDKSATLDITITVTRFDNDEGNQKLVFDFNHHVNHKDFMKLSSKDIWCKFKQVIFKQIEGDNLQL